MAKKVKASPEIYSLFLNSVKDKVFKAKSGYYFIVKSLDYNRSSGGVIMIADAYTSSGVKSFCAGDYDLHANWNYAPATKSDLDNLPKDSDLAQVLKQTNGKTKKVKTSCYSGKMDIRIIKAQIAALIVSCRGSEQWFKIRLFQLFGIEPKNICVVWKKNYKKVVIFKHLWKIKGHRRIAVAVCS